MALTILLVVSNANGELLVISDEELASFSGAQQAVQFDDLSTVEMAEIDVNGVPAAKTADYSGLSLNPYRREGGITIELSFRLTIGQLVYTDTDGY